MKPPACGQTEIPSAAAMSPTTDHHGTKISTNHAAPPRNQPPPIMHAGAGNRMSDNAIHCAFDMITVSPSPITAYPWRWLNTLYSAVAMGLT